MWWWKGIIQCGKTNIQKAPLFNDVSWTIKTFHSRLFASCWVIQSSALVRGQFESMWWLCLLCPLWNIPVDTDIQILLLKETWSKGACWHEIRRRANIIFHWQVSVGYLYSMSTFQLRIWAPQVLCWCRSLKWGAEESCLMTCLLHMPALFMTSKIQTAGYFSLNNKV